MKRNGSILIFVLLTFTLISTTAMLVVFMATEQIDIANNSIINIQSQYLAESKINRIFYDDKYYDEQLYPAIINHLETSYPRFILNKEDLIIDDKKKIVEGRFYDFQGKRYIELTATSDYKGRNIKMISSGPVFNDIFYDNNPALSKNTININYLNEFNDYMDEIGDTIDISSFPNKSMEFNDYETLIMRNVQNNTNQITPIGFNGEVSDYQSFNSRNDRVFIVVRNSTKAYPPTLFIDNYVDFRGILYVEGDLVINSNFRCVGILIVKGNIIFNDNLSLKPEIRGALLYDGEINLNKWNLRYDISNINTFGIYLPKFIRPKLEVHKIMEGN